MTKVFLNELSSGAYGHLCNDSFEYFYIDYLREESGWKIHVSAYPAIAPIVLSVVLPIMAKYNCPFKVMKNEDVLTKNLSDSNNIQTGKFITIYPNKNNYFDICKDLIYRILFFIKNQKIWLCAFSYSFLHSRWKCLPCRRVY